MSVLQLFLSLHSVLQSNLQENQSTTVTSLSLSCLMQGNLMVPEVVQEILPKLLFDELVEALPLLEEKVANRNEGLSSKQPKRSLSESKGLVLEVSKASALWSECISCMNLLLSSWQNVYNGVEIAQIPTNGHMTGLSNETSVTNTKLDFSEREHMVLIKKYIVLAANVTSKLPRNYLHKLRFFPHKSLLLITSLIQDRIATLQDPELVVFVFQLLHAFVWFCNVVETESSAAYPSQASAEPDKKRQYVTSPSKKTGTKVPSIPQQWLMLGSLPFMKCENDWLDLEVSNKREVTQWITAAAWVNDSSVLECSLKIAACSARAIAPNWRMKVFLRAMNMKDFPRLPTIIAQYLPLILHNLGTESVLCGNLLDSLINHENTSTVASLARSLRYLMCAKLNLVRLVVADGIPATSPHVLECAVCDAPSTRDLDQSASNRSASDQTVCSRIMTDGLLSDSGSASTSSFEDKILSTSALQHTSIPSSGRLHNSDESLLDRLYPLLHKSDVGVSLGMVYSLPAFMHHGRFSSQHLYQYLEKLFHPHLVVQQSFAAHLSSLYHLKLFDDPSVSQLVKLVIN